MPDDLLDAPSRTRGRCYARRVPLRFSRRLAWDRPENGLAEAERARRARGEPLLDLTVSNPTRVGLPDLGPRVREALAASASGVYEPDPSGLASARAAIAAELAVAGTPVAPERLLLTASSSESYAFLFKLLCDPWADRCRATAWRADRSPNGAGSYVRVASCASAARIAPRA